MDVQHITIQFQIVQGEAYTEPDLKPDNHIFIDFFKMIVSEKSRLQKVMPLDALIVLSGLKAERRTSISRMALRQLVKDEVIQLYGAGRSAFYKKL